MKIRYRTQAIMTAAMIGGALCLLTSNANAITGVCSNCHTMHTSQNGTGQWNPATDGGGDPGSMGAITSPQGALTSMTCVACHTDDTGNTLNSLFAPGIVRSSHPTNWLPGGYLDTAAGSDKQKHNVLFQDDKDTYINSYTPPGWDADHGKSDHGIANAGAWSTLLTCAGTYGCHGERDTTDQGSAISGGHHNTTAVGYRLLVNTASDGTSAGKIHGSESPNYVISENVYDGKMQADPNEGLPSDESTISALCGQCHSDFHFDDSGTTVIGTGSANWIRHPTDYALSDARTDTDDYANVNYNAQYPYGKPLDGVASTASPTQAVKANAVVLCLSCHFAHGGPNDDLLRWTYAGMSAGTTGDQAGEGCFGCHTNKDGS